MPVFAFPVGAVVHKQKAIVAAFHGAGATAPERATTPEALAIHQGLAFRILRKNGVLRDAGGQRLWVDEAIWNARITRLRRIGLTIAGTALLFLGALVLWLALR